MSSTPLTPSDASSDGPVADALTVPARLDQLRRITEFVGRLAKTTGFSGVQLNRIELAVDEACSNIIQHAYAERGDGDIYIHVRSERNRRIVISVFDTGKPFDPDSIPEHDPTHTLDDLKVGGLGLYLMRQAMDDVRFEFGVSGVRPDDSRRYNRLTLTKNV